MINVPIAVLGAACAVRLIPDSKNPAALAPDLVGALLSIAGLGLVLWSLIEAPVRGWSSPLVAGAGPPAWWSWPSSAPGSGPVLIRC